MNLTRPILTGFNERIPRVSGDEPVFPLFPLLTNLYSPRERG